VIPVIGTAYIARSDLLVEMVTSIDHPVQDLVIIDNSSGDTCPRVDEALTIRMHRNAGVSGAWNLIIKTRPKAAWWCIVNSDITFGPHDLEQLEQQMEGGKELVLLESMAAFGISRACIKQVGWFDEMFVPAYCEDNDYIYLFNRGAAYAGNVTLENGQQLIGQGVDLVVGLITVVVGTGMNSGIALDRAPFSTS